MQHSPSEIKEKLLKALDKEYNVVDMGSVVEIITILERTPISKEALETTRLGKYVNELRRKTKDDLLAKRAKDLVRRWRDMIQEHSSVSTSAASGIQSASLTGQNLHSSTVSHQGSGPLVNPALRSGPGLLHHASASPGGIGLSRSSHGIMSSSATSSSSIKCLSSGGNIAQSSLSISGGNSNPMISQPKFSHSSLVSDSTGRQLHPSTTVNIDPVPRTHASNKRLRKSSPTVESVHVKKRSCHNGQMARSLDFQKSYTPSQPDIHCERSRDSISGFSQSSSSCELIPLHSKVPIIESVFDVTAAITSTASTTTTTATISTATPMVTTVATSICASVISTSIAPVVSCTPTTNTPTIGCTSVTATAPTVITTSVAITSATDTTAATIPGTSSVVPTGMFSAHCTEVSNLTDTNVNTASAARVMGSSPIKIAERRGRKKRVKLNNSSESTGGMSSGSAGDILKEKLASKVRTSKVKTTKELVAFVQGKHSGPPEEILADTKVAISKTSLKESAVVKWGGPTDALEVTRNKKEHIVKYLQSQSELRHMEEDPSVAPVGNLDDLRLQKHLRISHTDNGSDNYNLSPAGMSSMTKDAPQTLSSKDSVCASVVETNVQDETVEDILARLPPVDYDAICWDDLADDVELKASINKEVTEELVTKLQVEHVEGVNGNIDDGAKPGEGNSDFREWHETVSKKSYQGEFLHILPYVVID